jgi:hypothetical protein
MWESEISPVQGMPTEIGAKKHDNDKSRFHRLVARGYESNECSSFR